MTEASAVTFRSRYMKGLCFELRPVSSAGDRAVAILYRRDGNTYTQCGVGTNASGEWQDSKGKPIDPDGLYWADMVPDD